VQHKGVGRDVCGTVGSAVEGLKGSDRLGFLWCCVVGSGSANGNRKAGRGKAGPGFAWRGRERQAEKIFPKKLFAFSGIALSLYRQTVDQSGWKPVESKTSLSHRQINFLNCPCSSQPKRDVTPL